jgi:hypothetical protein
VKSEAAITGNSSGQTATIEQSTSVEGKAFSSQSRGAWYFQSFLDKGGSGDRVVIAHTGRDTQLRDRLFNELQQRSVGISLADDKVADNLSPHFIVAWGIRRQEKSVTVSVILTVGNESKTFSFSSNGTCPEQACEKAIKDAVSGVFAIVQRLSSTKSV